mmetsp:Transcript_5430/g.11165  ORF Transcript_5430/g.11165 Transcript_5430/m.11165 type:complete len:104 (+) Transcript_5430:3101-3412(+)
MVLSRFTFLQFTCLALLATLAIPIWVLPRIAEHLVSLHAPRREQAQAGESEHVSLRSQGSSPPKAARLPVPESPFSAAKALSEGVSSVADGTIGWLRWNRQCR